MIWLTWRQFRTQALAALAVLAATATYVLITGPQMRHTYNADLAACKTPRLGCGSLLPQVLEPYQSAEHLLGLLLLVLPALIGIFWGAPLVAAEFERGTHRMAWNQSVTPARWLAVKLSVVGLATVAATGLFSLMITWWSGPIDHITHDRFGALTFAARDIVPFGYAAFAFALGTTLGLFLRRSLLAMALVLALFIPLQVLFASEIRANLLPTTTATMAINGHTLGNQANGISQRVGDPAGPITVLGLGPASVWIQSATSIENHSGQTIPGTQVAGCLNEPNASMANVGDCLAPYDLHVDYTYQPASNYWPLQWFETGIYLALAGLLTGACFWRIRRHRD